MLEEAIEVMRLLWQGGYQSHYGKHYTVEQARIYTLPDEPVPIAVAAAQPIAAQLAGRLGDVFIGVSPEAEIVQEFEGAGEAALRPADRLLRRERGRGQAHGARDLAQRRHVRPDRAGARDPVALRGRRRAARRGPGRRDRDLRA